MTIPLNLLDPLVTMNTSKGAFTFELLATKVPATVSNFLSYTHSGFYGNTIFHRVLDGFVTQGGGYTTSYTLKTTQAPIALESQAGLSNVRGTLGMARSSEPNSATSQFFVNTVDNSVALDYKSATSPGYAVFANVLQGMDVVDSISKSPVNNSTNGVPVTQVVIYSAKSTMVYPEVRASYQVSPMVSDVVTVANVASSSPSVTLTNIDRLQFSDVSLAFDVSGDAGQVYRLYQAAFNRTPDRVGLGYWIAQADKGVSLNNIAAAFIGSTEFSNAYGNLNTLTINQFISQLYMNVLHRAGEAAGVSYWSTALENRTYTPGQVLAGFSDSTENQAALIGVMSNGMAFSPFDAA